MTPQDLMKQEVGKAAAARVQSNSIVGLGTGSTTAYAIEYIGKRLAAGEITNVKGIPTSFQATVLAKQYGIPLTTLDEVDRIDIAIDGADEVDPHKNLIKGGGAAHTQEKVVDALAAQFIVVVDNTKLVDKLGSTFQNLELAVSNFKRQQLLFSQKVIPLAELENAKGEVYKHELNIKNVRSHIEELNGQILQLRKGILEVNQSSKESNSTKYVSLVESIQQLRTAVQKWKQQYLLTAPISGKVSLFNNFWAENQDVKDGSEVMAIIPPNGSNKVGFVSLPTFGSGKVKQGQRVVIKFESYPYQEHGVVEGTVDSKALLPKDKTISVRVTLPNGLKTSYGKELKYDQQMQGLAEVITEERRFIERMFDKLISAIKNH